MKTMQNHTRSAAFKYLLAVPLCLGLMLATPAAKAQTPPNPGTPPPPPPSPKEMFNKINPFKKKKDTTATKPKTNKSDKTPDAVQPEGGPPPPPPNPLDLFKKKDKKTPATTKV